MAAGFVWIGLVLFYGLLVFRVASRNRGGFVRVRRNRNAPFIELLQWTKAFERLEPNLQRQRMALAILEGGHCPPERLIRWVAEGVAVAYAGLTACWLVAHFSGNPAIGWVGTAICGCVPALRGRDLYRQVERRRRAVVMELPVLLSRLLVLVNAGENVMRALTRCSEGRPANDHPLYDELSSALSAMQRGESMSLAMDEFGRRCAVAEAKLFAATLLMNARRGGEEFVPALRDLTRQMWEKRKALARTLGEQASSRLAFPLAVIFLLIVVLVAAPTVFMM
jgi:tight adherence protein C